MQQKKISKNYLVAIYENNYPNPGGIATLVGIYPTHPEAAFISKAVKDRNKLPFFPIIEPTDYPPTTMSVANHLERMREDRKDRTPKD